MFKFFERVRLGLVLVPLMMTSCANGPGFMGAGFSVKSEIFPDRLEQTDEVDQANAVTEERGTTTQGPPGNRVQYFGGSGGRVVSAPNFRPSIERVEDGLRLNFLDTEIKVLVAAVLGDMLGVPYQLDPAIQGNVSLQTIEPISDKSVLIALEAALQTKNVVMYMENGAFIISSRENAPQQFGVSGYGIPAGPLGPGFKVQVIELQYATPSEMRKVLEPFSPQGGILVVDDTRQLLVLAGTGAELGVMLSTIQTFDVDWLEGMSFALYGVEYVEAKTLTDELLQIFGDANSPLVGMVRLIPIDRLNAILGISAQPKYLQDVEKWVERLDIGGSSPGRRIYVYHVNHGRAADIASALSSVIGGVLQGTTENSSNSFQNARNASATTSLSRARSSTASGLSGGQTSTNLFENSNLKIVPNEENNSIMILASPSEFSVISSAIAQIDVSPRQVLIEATLVEVQLNDELRFGVNWFLQQNESSLTYSSSSGANIASQFPGFSFIYDRSVNARAVLNTLASVTDVKVLSSPKLMVLNNQTASIQVGDQVPVAIQSAVSITDGNAPIVNTVQFKDTGVIMTVTPRIGKDGAVLLDVEQEVSDVVATTTSGIDSPTIQQRKIASTVVVRDGETIALGGLIRETESVGSSGLPLLKSIPLIGHVFSTNNRVSRRTELIILITPHIATDQQQIRDVVDYLRQQFHRLEQSFSAGDLNEGERQQ